MSIIQGIQQGINSGIIQGINASFGAISTLTSHFDFSTPVVQPFPTTAEAMATSLGSPTALPTSIYECQEGSGNLTDTLGGVDLIAAGAPYRQTAVGIDGGSGYTSRLAVEFADGNSSQRYKTTDDTFMDVGTSNSIAVVMAVRFHTTPSAVRHIVHKRASAGWYIRQQVAGNCFAFLFDGVSSPGLGTSTNVSDGAWHYIAIVINRTTEVAYMFDDQAETSLDISSYGSFSNTETFAIGDSAFLAPGMQCTYVACFEDAAAEDITKAKLDNWWVHASDPTGLLTTVDRASTISVPVSATQVAHFAHDTLPIGYSAGFTNSSKLGLYCNSNITNLNPYSEDITTWTHSNTSSVTKAGDSPDGFRTASSILALANNGTVRRNSLAVATSTEYTASFWVRRNGATDVSGLIRVYDDIAATFTDQAFTATDSWQLVSVTMTTDASATVIRHYCQIDTSGDSIFMWGAQFNLGNARGAYIRTNGASASLAKHDYHGILPEGIKTTRGESRGVIVRELKTSDYMTMFNYKTAVGNTSDNRHDYRFNITNDQMVLTLFTDSGLVESATGISDPTTAGVEFDLRVLWDYVNGVDAGGVNRITYSTWNDGEGEIINPKELEDLSGSTTETGLLTKVQIGSATAASYHLNGWIQSIKTYSEPQEL